MSDHQFGLRCSVFCVFHFYFPLSFMTLIPHTSHFSFVGLSVVGCIFGQRMS